MLSHGRPPSSDTNAVYGRHLMLRLGDVENGRSLDCPEAIEQYLTGLVTGIGMRILDGPHVSTEDSDPARYGHSGVVVLYESHAAVHTYPLMRAMFLDVFSCKSFDVADVVRITAAAFGSFRIVETNVLDRGTHWSTDAESELAAWHADR